MLRGRPRLRLALLAAGIAILFAAAARGIPHSPAGLKAAIAGYGAAAPFVFGLVWIALTPALVSGTLLAAAGGLLFGPVVGTIVGVAGATLGGGLSFSIARRGGAPAVAGLAGPRVSRLQARVERRPFRNLLVLRLAPGVPTTLLNYAAGLTRIRLRTFLAAIAVGGFPRIFVYTALGGSLAHPASPLAFVSVGLFVLLTAAGLVVAVRKRLRRARLA